MQQDPVQLPSYLAVHISYVDLIEMG